MFLPLHMSLWFVSFPLMLAVSVKAADVTSRESGLYVQVADSSAATSAPCGTLERPCATLSLAIQADDSTSRPLTITFLPSRFDRALVPEVLVNISKIRLDGSPAGTLQLRQALDGNSSSSRSAWLAFLDCKDILVTNLNVDLSFFNTSTALLFDGCQNVTVSQCTFSAPKIRTQAMELVDSWPVLINQSSFVGSKVLHAPLESNATYTMSAIRILIHCSPVSCANATDPRSGHFGRCCSKNLTSSLDTQHSINISVNSCTFTGLGMDRIFDIYNRLMHSQSASALFFHLEQADGVGVTITNCSFVNNSSPYDSTIKFGFTDVSNSRTSFVKCRFSGNVGYKGGVLLWRLEKRSYSNFLSVTDSLFDGNAAYWEGGAILIHFYSLPTVQQTTNSVVLERCNFTDNLAGYLFTGIAGGAATFQSRSPFNQEEKGDSLKLLPRVDLRNCRFEANQASFGSAVFVSGVLLGIHNIDAINNQLGACIYSSSSLLQLFGHHNYKNNTGASSGGVMALTDFSLVKFGKGITGHIEGNSAEGAGGVLYADVTSSALGLTGYLQAVSGDYSSKLCFVQIDPNATLYPARKKSSVLNQRDQIVFVNNTAGRGHRVYASSLSACLNHNSPMISSPNITERKEEYGKNFGTAPVWVFFKSATCDCLKPIPGSEGKHWLLQRNCTRENFYEKIAKKESMVDYLQLLSFIRMLQGKLVGPNLDGSAVVPGESHFFSPWGTNIWQWFYPRGIKSELDAKLNAEEIAGSWAGNVTLYPAPGEEFTLQLDIEDAFLSDASTTVSLTVSRGTPVLLRQGTKQFAHGSRLFLNGLNNLKMALAGAPETAGHLSIDLTRPRGMGFITLTIPFRLQPCHLGFAETELMADTEEAKALRLKHIAEFHTKTIFANSDTDLLVCRCMNKSGVRSCKDGKDVVLDWKYWAGDTNNSSGDSTHFYRFRLVENISIWEKRLYERHFETSPCYNGYCSSHDFSLWSLRNDNPCTPSSHRTGLLCSQCVQGYSKLPCTNLQACVGCPSPRTGLAILIISLFVYAGFALLFMAYFKLGESVRFESWVTYDNIISFVLRREYSFYSFSAATFTGVCINKHLNGAQQIASLYIVPAAFFLWVPLVFQLSRITAIRRLVINHNVVSTLWAFASFSYASVVYPSLALLSCFKLDDRYVLYNDASTQCFGHEHLPYGILAIFVILFIAIPVPILLFAKRSHPRLKPLVDVYLSYVKEKRRWWIGFSVARRLFIAVLAATIGDSFIRQIVLATAIQLLVFLQFYFRPYRSHKSNCYEAALLGNAAVFAMLNVVNKNEEIKISLFVIYLWPSVLSLSYGLYVNRQRMARDIMCFSQCLCSPFFQRSRSKLIDIELKEHALKKPLREDSQSQEVRARDLYELRENLLADQFAGDGDQKS